MSIGRIGTTPVLTTRWSKAPAGGTTSLSGLDDNSVSLVYSVGYEAVYRNGVLLSRGNDYTATDGTTITLIDATIAGDIIEVFANQLVPLSDAISKGQFTAKGSLLSATAASTPAVLAVGSNDQVLTADSTTATGLKWATPSAGSLTSLATGSLSTNSVTISSISSAYTHLQLFLYDFYPNTDGDMYLQFNSNTGGVYGYVTTENRQSTTDFSGSGATEIRLARVVDNTSKDNSITLNIWNYADTNAFKTIGWNYINYKGNDLAYTMGSGAAGYQDTAAISSMKIYMEGVRTFTGGSYALYGVK